MWPWASTLATSSLEGLTEVQAGWGGGLVEGMGMLPFLSTSLSLDQQGHLQGRLPPGQHHLAPGPLPGHTLHRCGGWSLCGRGGGSGSLHVPEWPQLAASQSWHLTPLLCLRRQWGWGCRLSGEPWLLKTTPRGSGGKASEAMGSRAQPSLLLAHWPQPQSRVRGNPGCARKQERGGLPTRPSRQGLTLA